MFINFNITAFKNVDLSFEKNLQQKITSEKEKVVELQHGTPPHNSSCNTIINTFAISYKYVFFLKKKVQIYFTVAPKPLLLTYIFNPYFVDSQREKFIWLNGYMVIGGVSMTEFIIKSGGLRARSDSTNVQADLALHSKQNKSMVGKGRIRAKILLILSEKKFPVFTSVR